MHSDKTIGLAALSWRLGVDAFAMVTAWSNGIRFLERATPVLS